MPTPGNPIKVWKINNKLGAAQNFASGYNRAMRSLFDSDSELDEKVSASSSRASEIVEVDKNDCSSAVQTDTD